MTESELAQQRSDLERTFGTPHGRRVLWMMLSEANPHAESYHDSARRTAYNLGLRAWGRKVIVLMHGSRRLRAILRKMEDEHQTPEEEK